MTTAEPLLEVTDLQAYFHGFKGQRVVKAVDGISFTLNAGDVGRGAVRGSNATDLQLADRRFILSGGNTRMDTGR